MNMSKRTKISQAVTTTNGAAGTTAITGAVLDMSGFESAMVLVTFGAITAGAVTSIKMQQGDASDLSDATDLAGTGQTIADTDDDKTFYIDLVKPAKRYCRLYVSRGTQNAVVASATYIQYEGKKVPATHGTNVAGETWQTPDAGTA